jgi:polysaccharide export outer membrane protein
MKKLLTSCSVMFLLSTVAAAQAPASRQSPPSPGPAPVPLPAGPGGSPAKPTTGSTIAKAASGLAADYRLVPGDKLRVEVYKDVQLSQSVQVRPDGKITLPLANDVLAAGKTPTELRDAIAESLKSYIANPTVTVMVVETVPPVIYVIGEVNTAGPQPMVGRLDILQALSTAGGFKDFANTKDIKVRRGTQILKFNYKEAVEGRAAPLLLQPGDTIIVR